MLASAKRVGCHGGKTWVLARAGVEGVVSWCRWGVVGERAQSGCLSS